MTTLVFSAGDYVVYPLMVSGKFWILKAVPLMETVLNFSSLTLSAAVCCCGSGWESSGLGFAAPVEQKTRTALTT